jgi:hypothetical protein
MKLVPSSKGLAAVDGSGQTGLLIPPEGRDQSEHSGKNSHHPSETDNRNQHSEPKPQAKPANFATRTSCQIRDAMRRIWPVKSATHLNTHTATSSN